MSQRFKRKRDDRFEDLITFIAIYRLTRLITKDQITQKFRDDLNVSNFKGDLPDWANYLVTCPWCISIWIGFVVLTTRRIFPRTWRFWSRVLTGSAVAGLLTVVEGSDG